LRIEATKYNGKYKTRFRKRRRQKETISLAVLRCYLLGEDKSVPVHDMKIYRCMAPLILNRGIQRDGRSTLSPGLISSTHREGLCVCPKAGQDAVRKRQIYFSCRIVWPIAWS
jgi:hypothetical protein